jgi:hypothetical protein
MKDKRRTSIRTPLPLTTHTISDHGKCNSPIKNRYAIADPKRCAIGG